MRSAGLRTMPKVELCLPAPHPKQLLALRTLANEVLYGGATRGGKSHLVRLAYSLWCVHVPNLQCDIFRLTLDDCIAECMDGQYSFPDLLAPLEREKLVRINQTEVKFWNGSLISLEHCGRDSVKDKHQGIAKHVRAFIEATQISTEIIRWLRGWVTMSEAMKDTLPDCLRPLYPDYSDEQLRSFFPKLIYATNPIGPSAGYFRRYFVNARPRYEIGQAPIDDGGFMRQYIPAKIEDNPSEDAEATRRRVRGIGDDAVSDALLNEDWDAPVGDFFRQYDDLKHTVPDFVPPAHWFKYRTFDWGSSDPAVCLWWAVSDGSPVIVDDKEWIFPRGAIVCYREWYIADSSDPSKGRELTNEEIAAGIVERTPEETTGITLCDSLPFAKRGESRNGKPWTMADTFRDCGVPLTRANTERVFGCREVKTRLQGKDGFPMLYLCQSCHFTREYLPAVPTDPHNREAYVEDGEATHCADCVRYACASRPIVRDKPKDEAPRPSSYSPPVSSLLNQIRRPATNNFARR